MDSLLCEEVWLSGPTTPSDYQNQQNCSATASFCTTEEDCKQALATHLNKELSYMPQNGYVEEHLRSKNLLFARSRAIHWLIRSRLRLNLSFETLFNAANYLDRFISMHQSHGWKYWMVELLSVACLSVASKFTETCSPCLHEIQMEDLDHSFQPVTIQRMELVLLEALGWRLCSTTPYSYVDLLTTNIDCLKSDRRQDLVARIIELLLGAMIDCKMIAYRPSIAAASALWCGLQELVPSNSEVDIAHITGFLNQDQKDDLFKCHTVMERQLMNPVYNLVACDGNSSSYYCPSSPVTVLPAERTDIYDCHVDLSFFKVSGPKIDNQKTSKKKRKRDEQ